VAAGLHLDQFQEDLSQFFQTVRRDRIALMCGLEGMLIMTNPTPRSAPIGFVLSKFYVDDSPYLFRKLDEHRCA
jgi:hypothetical protein